MKDSNISKRFRRVVKKDYSPLPSPRLKQLYFNKYLTISQQYSVRWQDMLKVGISSCPGMFLHAVAMPEFIKQRGISRWPLITLTGFLLSHLLHDNPYPNIESLSRLLNTDRKTIRAAVIWCLDHNFVGFVNKGSRGRRPDGKFGPQQYYLTLKGQEILNEYYDYCHAYYDQVSHKLRIDPTRKYSNF